MGLVADFRGTLKQDPAIAGLPVPPSPAFLGTGHPGSMYSAGAQLEGFVSPRGSLLQHSDCLMWEHVEGGVGPQAHTWGTTHLQPYPTPTTSTHGEDYVGTPHPRIWEPGEKPASADRFRMHKGDVLGLHSVDLFGLNGQRMEKPVFVTTMHI